MMNETQKNRVRDGVMKNQNQTPGKTRKRRQCSRSDYVHGIARQMLRETPERIEQLLSFLNARERAEYELALIVVAHASKPTGSRNG